METHQQTRHSESNQFSSLIKQALLVLIRIYQVGISPWLGKNCRFYPTCSCYTHEAIRTHGPWRGLGLGIFRIAKCHPWHPGGVDLVPEKHHSPSTRT